MAEAPTVISYLRSWAQFAEMNGQRSWESWLLRHGVPMGPRMDGEKLGVPNMPMKECFSNAFAVGAYNEWFTYCEGFAYTPGLITVHHAWLLTATGRVIDPTWHEGRVCGFCLGDRIIERDLGNDESEEIECFWCDGTGESDHEHPSREGVEYFGIAIPDKTWLIKEVLKKGTYTIFPECIESWERRFGA